MGRTFTLHSIARARTYEGVSLHSANARRASARAAFEAAWREYLPKHSEADLRTHARPEASRQVRSTLGLFARVIDFHLFVFVHFFDGRILVALTGCLSSCGWRAVVRNRCLPLRRRRGPRCCCGLRGFFWAPPP